MELKNFSQEVNEQLFGKGSRQVSMGEFIDMSVSAHKSRSDEQNVIRETAAGNKIVIKELSFHKSSFALWWIFRLKNCPRSAFVICSEQ